MDEFCQKCGTKLKEEAQFCPNCGMKVKSSNRKYFILIFVIVIILACIIAFSFVSNQTQVVKVDNVEFELPSDYSNVPSRTEVNYDQGVKSSSMGWSNDENYIEIGVTRTPGAGINSKEVAASLGGSPTKMFGYDGYYQKYDEEGYSFVFGMKDKVCMIYVSDYDAFDDVKVISSD